MRPAAPPLPVPRNLPFQVPGGGIQTSILMCDSLVGLIVAATRQNGAETFAPPRPPGILSAVVMDVAIVMVESFNFSEERLSQDAGRGLFSCANANEIAARPANRNVAVVTVFSFFSWTNRIKVFMPSGGGLFTPTQTVCASSRIGQPVYSLPTRSTNLGS